MKAGLYAEFTITNEDLGVEYINRFNVSVYSTYYSGWMLLADKGNVSELSMFGMMGDFMRIFIKA